MKKLNKSTKIIIAVALIIVICIPCGFLIARWTSNKKADIVVTMFSQYDWTKQVLGSNPAGLRVKYLMDNGVDPHSYEPSIQDTAEIIQSRLFIYVGEAETNVRRILRNNPNSSRRELALMNVVGGEIYKHENQDHDCDADCDHEHTGDEHIWLSLRFAQRFVAAIANEIARLDSKNGDYYMANAQKYNEKLVTLDTEYEQVFNKALEGNPIKPLLFADRFPFIYLLQDYDYGIRDTHWIAAFTYCGAVPENISPTMINNLRQAITNHSLSYVFILENSTFRPTAESIAASSGRNPTVLVLNSIQSVTRGEVKNSTYIGIMTQNLENIKKALEVTI